MKRFSALVLCALLLLSGLSVQADAPAAYDPEAIYAEVKTVIAENFPNINAQMTYETAENGDITFLLNSVPVVMLCFNHIDEAGTSSKEGVKNSCSVIIIVKVADQTSMQMYISLFAVISASVRHVLHPEISVQDCATEVVTELQNAIDAGDETTGTAEADTGIHHETYTFSVYPDMILLSYQAQIIGLY